MDVMVAAAAAAAAATTTTTTFTDVTNRTNTDESGDPSCDHAGLRTGSGH
jgi:hypothetical protein